MAMDRIYWLKRPETLVPCRSASFFARSMTSESALSVNLGIFRTPDTYATPTTIPLDNPQSNSAPAIKTLRAQSVTAYGTSSETYFPGAGPVDLTLFCATPPSFLERQGQLQARFLIKSTGPAPGPQYSTDRHAIGQAANPDNTSSSLDIGTGSTETIYDAAGRVIGTDRVSGLIITVTTNAAGVASATLTNPGTVYSTTSQTLNAAGQVLSSTDAAGLVTTYTDDSLGHETSATVTSNPSPVTSYACALDNAGNRTGVTEIQLPPNGMRKRNGSAIS